MKNEFVLAFNEVLDDKQLPREVVMEALEAAMISAYRKAVNASNAQQVVAKIDPETGKVLIYAEKEVVEEVQDDRTEVSLEEARKVDPEAEIGSMVLVETTPRNFGRVAAQTARQVIQQRIREAEREAQFKHFSSQVGEIVNGIIQAINPSHITIGLDKKAEGIMPRKEQIAGERFRVHDRIRALLLDVKQTPRGPQITLSRAHRDFLRRLLEDEVPEIFHGLVEIRSIAREPGHRSKVAVSALQPGIDPVGACVGVRGVRIQAIVRELNDEKIDVIEWNPDPVDYIAKALSPARVVGVFLDEHTKSTKTATVVVPEDQLSLAIGRDGQNARLAAKLTGWRIDIKSLPEAAADAVHKLQTDPAYAEVAEREGEMVPQVEAILTKKTEGRPITPEEYQVLSRFVNRTERMVIEQREAEKQAERERLEAIRASIPKIAFETPLDELGISVRHVILLSGEGYPTVGDLLYQMAIDSDAILAINGMGPKAMADLDAAIEKFLASIEEAAAEEAAEEEIPEAAAEMVVDAAGETEETAAPVQAAEAISEGTLQEAVAGEAGEPPAEDETQAEAEETGESVEEAGEQPATEEAEDDAGSTTPQKDWFTLESALDVSVTNVDEGEEEQEGKKKKKRKKRYVEMEYDPDRDVTVIKRKRKRASKDEWLEDWDEDWDY